MLLGELPFSVEITDMLIRIAIVETILVGSVAVTGQVDATGNMIRGLMMDRGFYTFMAGHGSFPFRLMPIARYFLLETRISLGYLYHITKFRICQWFSKNTHVIFHKSSCNFSEIVIE